MLSRLAYAAEVAPIVKRGRVMSMMGGIGKIGALIGPLLGGLVAAKFGLAAVFFVQALFACAALAALFFWNPHRRFQYDPR